jgi:hypothetical protein
MSSIIDLDPARQCEINACRALPMHQRATGEASCSTRSRADN